MARPRASPWGWPAAGGTEAAEAMASAPRKTGCRLACIGIGPFPEEQADSCWNEENIENEGDQDDDAGHQAEPSIDLETGQRQDEEAGSEAHGGRQHTRPHCAHAFPGREDTVPGSLIGTLDPGDD